ncbi:hypothetical protein R3P38DRAFT_3413436 [Favolaschia claudopus]|uniref:Uncharacterized protein n=1 Tax=Favolaschia claudopus TaxID=2862362 RepID=A0AAV9Z3M7_9AGAR
MATNENHNNIPPGFQIIHQFRRFLVDHPEYNNIPAALPSTPTPAARTGGLAEDENRDNSAAPVRDRYESARAQTQALVAPPSYQSALGPATLAPSNPRHVNQERLGVSNLNTSAVNRDRVNHALATLPRSSTSSLAVRNRRTRGPARGGPVLASRPQRRAIPDVSHCLEANADTPTARIIVLVYPPLSPHAGPREFLVYNILHLDFLETLEENHLLYRYILPLNTRVNDLLRMAHGDMVVSGARFGFEETIRSSAAAAVAVTTIQPLGLADRGRTSAHFTGPRLRVIPQPLQTTLHELSLDRNHFADPGSFRDGSWIIRLAVMGTELSYISSDGRRHGHDCLGQHIYSLFPCDGNSMRSDDDVNTSGGEEVDSEEEEHTVARLLWTPRLTRSNAHAAPAPQNTPAGSAPATTPSRPRVRTTADAATSTSELPRRVLRDPASTASAAPAPATVSAPPALTRPPRSRRVLGDLPVPRARTRSLSPEPDFSLPRRLWGDETTYEPHSRGDFSPNRFTHDIMQRAVEGAGSVPPLSIRGANIDQMVDALVSVIDRLGRTGDYTELLNPDRSFVMTTDEAVGEGVEREVVHAALHRELAEESTYFNHGEDNVLTLRVLPSSIPASPARLAKFKRLGALCGLSHILGQSTPSISVALFQYIVNHCDFRALSRNFSYEWFPVLTRQLLDFLATSETDDLSAFQTHLITYYGAGAAAFRYRDRATHDSLAVHMLYFATVANGMFDEPEPTSFRTGYLLSCRNGITLAWAIRNFEGGPDTFFSVMATSRISSADSLLAVLDIVNASNSAELLDSLRGITGDITLTFHMLIERYLRGIGTPCPAMFAAAKGAFHSIIDLDRIDSPAFRSQMLAWAATGSPFVDPAGGRISLGPINTHGEGYGVPGSTAGERDVLAREGTFHIQTCHRSIRFPVEYALRLAEARYVPEGEPRDFQEAFDYWFLTQSLIAIGRHSMM